MSQLSPIGEVRVEGVIWRAKSRSGDDVPLGAPVEVKSVDGISLTVERITEETKPGGVERAGQG